MKKIVLSFLSVLVMHAFVLACGCPDVNYSFFSQSDYFQTEYIFEGRVTKIEKSEEKDYYKSDVLYFEVTKNYKGKMPSNTGVAVDNGNYYIGYKEGDRMLVYTSKNKEGEYAMRSCNRTRNLNVHEKYLADLRAEIEEMEMGLEKKDLGGDELKKLEKQLGYKKENLSRQEGNLAYEYEQLALLESHKNKQVELYSYDKSFMAKGKLKKGQCHGVWKSYSNDRLLGFITYKDGKMDGERVSYFDDGSKSSVMYYKEGRSDGHWINYYKDGTIRSKRQFVEGRSAGTHIFYQKDGTVKNKYHYVDGELVKEKPKT